MKIKAIICLGFACVLNGCSGDDECSQILSLVHDENLHQKLLNWFSELRSDPALLDGVRAQNSLAFKYLVEKDIGTDLNTSKIKAINITFGFYGEKLDNDKFDFDKVDFFVLGNRYRHRFYMKVPHSTNFDFENIGYKSEDFNYKDDYFGVICPKQ